MTIKQKLAASKMVEYGGNMGKAMISAGYSKAMAKNPYKLIRSKGWLEATDGLLIDEEIVKTHAALLDSEDCEIRLKAIELGYKIKGLLNYSKGRKSGDDNDRVDDLEIQRLRRILSTSNV